MIDHLEVGVAHPRAGDEEREAALKEWLRRKEAMPFELRDMGLVKLFFADALDRDDAVALLTAVQKRSQERVARLREIEPAAQLAEEDGSAHPLLTLRIGIAFHQAMIDICQEFEQKHTRPRGHAP